MFFRSRNLFLRPLWPEDAVGLRALMGPTLFARANSWLDASDLHVASASAQQHPRLPRCLVTLPDRSGEHIVGVAALLARTDGVYLEIWIGHEYRGKGFGREVTRAMTEMARAVGHSELKARIEGECVAGKRALVAAGFSPLAGRELHHQEPQRSPDVDVCLYETALISHGKGICPPSFAA